MIQGMYIAIFALVNITMVGLECGCFCVHANNDVEIIPKSPGLPNLKRKDTTEKLC